MIFFKQKNSKGISKYELEIKELRDKLDENDTLREEITVLEKNAGSNTSSGSQESYGVVGEEIDLAMLQNFYTSEGWVYIAIWSIAKTIATLPIKLEKRRVTKESLTDQNGNEVDTVFRESWIEANAEPEYDILSRPNNSQLPVEFWMLILIDLLSTGNAYILVDKGDDAVDVERPVSRLESILREQRRLNVKGIYRLNSALMEPQTDIVTMALTGYVMQGADGLFEFDTNQIIHLRLPNPADPIIGLSPLVPVLKNILIDRFSTEHMIRFYKQGARLGGVIKTTKKLTKEQVSRLTRSFESNFTGKRNHHKTLILPEGMEYKTIEVNPGETSLIEFSKFNKEPILSAFGVPPIKVGLLDGATFSNAVVQEKSFWENAALPIKCIIECGINNSNLILRIERNLKFSFDVSGIAVLQESMKDKSETAQRMMQSGWSVNEIRQEIWKKGAVDGGEIVPAIAKLQGAEGPFQFTAPIPGDDDGKALPDPKQPDLEGMTDIEQTTVSYESRVAELTAINLQAGIPLPQAVAAALELARLEGFLPEKDEEEKPPLEDEGEEESEGKHEGLTAKEIKMQHYCKLLTGHGVKTIMERKYELVKEMFDRMEVKLLDEIKTIDLTDEAIQESFKTLQKVDDEDDGEDLPIFKWLKQFAEAEAQILRDSGPDLDALSHGFDNTLTDNQATLPNIEAQNFLEERGAEQVTNITETTRSHMKNIIAQEFEKQSSPSEIIFVIQESFNGIREGRAKVITRTETLTAVSHGQEIKKEKVILQNPALKDKIKKRWITAQDSRVRDGSGKNGNDADHKSLDGDVVNDGESFDNGLSFPRESGSPAQESIQCRCAAIYFTDDDEAEIDRILPEESVLAQVVDAIF